ncbi:hypothetical protein SKAU_G00372470 [Synaphobranchus kaupii]|uniref:Uncharacterized protein n=1 Tax=Synaphobranchus kaupii TaxID=118154 RepID=A0A9Q1IG40_SYNKA|nr:hypothetical protein SKAU_G00372470 [Synaphobranchus kaupii]
MSFQLEIASLATVEISDDLSEERWDKPMRVLSALRIAHRLRPGETKTYVCAGGEGVHAGSEREKAGYVFVWPLTFEALWSCALQHCLTSELDLKENVLIDAPLFHSIPPLCSILTGLQAPNTV